MLLVQPAQLQRFRSLLESQLGLSFDQVRGDELAPLLAARVEETRSQTIDAYWQFLESPARILELRLLAGRLSVGETSFFRQVEHFAVLREVALPCAAERHLQRGGAVRILSAGCSTGEEPYTIAMVLQGALGAVSPSVRECVIDAVDINPAHLERARRGRYSEWSLRNTSAVVVERYFQQQGRDFVLDEQVRAQVEFHERSLAEADPTFWVAERYDVIFCRNVLMYFTREAARSIVERLAGALAPGGFLFLGHAETLRGLSQDFHLCHTHDAFYYRRLGESRTAAGPREDDASWVTSIASASERIQRLVSGPRRVASPPSAGPAGPACNAENPPQGLRSALEYVQQERFDEALSSLQALEADPDVLLMQTALLVNRGDLRQAEGLCRRLLEMDEMNAGAHYLLALCRDHSGDPAGAEDQYRTAIYLDAEFAMPRLNLGMALRRRGRLEEAEHELREALPLLAREDSSRVLLLGGGFGRETLMRLCANEMRACGGLS